MARAIIKNPVGTNSGWEDVKILIAKAYQQDYIKYTLTCSYEWVNYEVTFRILNWQFTVLSEQGDDMTWKRLELINLIEDMDSIKAILYMFETFYNLDLISEYDLLFQARDLEEIVEAYLNWWIVAWEVDSLWYWKTLFYKDWDNYIIWDKQSWNNITVSVRWDDIWFSVNWAEVLNDWLEIINKDVVENVFSLATKKWACYLPITRYEELLEFLGTKLSAFKNPSRFIEKEFDNDRRYQTEFNYNWEDPFQSSIASFYDWVEYTAHQDWEIEQWVPNIVIEYGEWWNDIVAWLMEWKLSQTWSILQDTGSTFNRWETGWLWDYYNQDNLNKVTEYVLNNSFEDAIKLYMDWWWLGYYYDEETETDNYDYLVTTIDVQEENLERIETPFYQRQSDRYWFIDDSEDVDTDLLNYMIENIWLIPLELYNDIISKDYQVIPATWIALNLYWATEIWIGEEPITMACSVLPTLTWVADNPSMVTNDKVSFIQDGFDWWEVLIEQDEYENWIYHVSWLEPWEVNLIAVSADWWFQEWPYQLTVLPQMYNITLSHIDWLESPVEVEEWTVISTDWDMIYIWEEACSANVEQWFVFDYFTATIDWETITLIDWEDITVESDMTLTAVSHENVSSYITLTLASSPSWHTIFMDWNQQTISSVTIPAWSTIYTSWNQVILWALEDQDTETIVDADVQMPYWPDHRELNWTTLEDFTDYTVGTSWTLTLVIS